MNEDPTLFLSKVLAFEVQTILDRDRTGLLILTALDTRHSLVPTKSVIYYIFFPTEYSKGDAPEKSKKLSKSRRYFPLLVGIISPNSIYLPEMKSGLMKGERERTSGTFGGILGFFGGILGLFRCIRCVPIFKNSVCQNKNWRTTWDLRTYVNHEMCHVVQKRRSAPLAWETLLWYIAKDIRSRWSR